MCRRLSPLVYSAMVLERLLGRDLAERQGRRVAVDQLPQRLEEGEILRPGVVVQVELGGIRVVGGVATRLALLGRLGRVVAQQPVMKAEVDRVEPEAVHAALQPELRLLEHLRGDPGLVKVQVRLADQEVVQVVLAAPRLPLPGGTAEDRQPVVGWRAVRLRVGPHVPVRLVVGAVLAARLEPGVLVRGVAQHLVDDDPDAALMRVLDEPVEVVERAEDRVDLPVLADVVAEVLHRRLEERGDPDRIDAEAGDVVEPCDDAWQVADAIAIAVGEAARIDLVDHGAAPPVRVRRARGAAGPAASFARFAASCSPLVAHRLGRQPAVLRELS